jgi:hypothetical protein
MRWRSIVAVAFAAVVTAVPAAAAGGATQTVETWSHVSGDLFYAGDGLCGTKTVAGPLVDGNGIARTTETPNGGSIVRGHSDDTWSLYEASGPPWDVTFGAFYGTMTVHVPFEELVPPSGETVLGNVSTGRLVRADGTWQTVHILFRMVIPPGAPPKFFIVRVTCGG